MWSAAVLEPALPGRSRAATTSLDLAGPWSTNATAARFLVAELDRPASSLHRTPVGEAFPFTLCGC